jgi:predicted membrane chloride channel (bestrophin family)
MQLHGGSVHNRGSFFAQLTRLRGSVLITVIPISFCSAIIAGALVMIEEKYGSGLWILPELRHPFVVQIFGIILSFVIVARTNIALGRYFDGIDHVHTMSTRWVDAYTSLLGFLRASHDLHTPGSPKQQACVSVGLAILHWGTLAHALAINSLQATQLGLEENIWQYRIWGLDPPENLNLTSGNAYTYKKRDHHRSRTAITKDAVQADRRLSITDGHGIIKEMTVNERALVKLGCFGEVSSEELLRLNGATDKVAIVLMWMEEAVSRGQIQGVLLVAPPIMSRFYNELGNGLEGFNEAYRIALVPFPFCFSQMIGWCLVVFFFLCPAVAFCFTGGELLTSTLTFFAMMGFWGLNRLAMELENPFGCKVNHLPLAEMHHAFVESLAEMHLHPMPEFKWEDDGESKDLPQLKRQMANSGK